MQAFRRIGALVLCLWLAACGGGGDSSTSTLTGAGLNTDLQSPSVATAAVFTQTGNNLRLTVEDLPSLRSGFSGNTANTNLLYADVKVCVPGDPTQCATIDHVLVDTGSVGLRVLASKVAGLPLPQRNLLNHPGENPWECYAFVIGGLWGRNAVADVWLGQQRTNNLGIPIQIIEEGGPSAVPPPQDCIDAVGGNPSNILTSAASLGANGILGVGSTPVDCGDMCISGTYAAAGAHIQYYRCPAQLTSPTQCSAATLQSNELVYNPVAALPVPFNNGMVIKLPKVSSPGAASARGELILGVNSVLPQPGVYSVNQVPASAASATLGVEYQTTAQLLSYLNVTTDIQGRKYHASYLDTGTNGLFFNHPSLTPLICADWYCPINPTTLPFAADILDAPSASVPLPPNPPPNKPSPRVNFQVGVSMFYSRNAAIPDNVGPAPAGTNAEESFAWGLPFFYGRQVYLKIWDFDPANPPWYAWAPL